LKRTTILVLSVDEAPLLEHSLPAAVAQPGADVLVVDNACTDTTRAIASTSTSPKPSYSDGCTSASAPRMSASRRASDR